MTEHEAFAALQLAAADYGLAIRDAARAHNDLVTAADRDRDARLYEGASKTVLVAAVRAYLEALTLPPAVALRIIFGDPA